MMPPLVALLAHPDDEFAIFPWLRAAVRAGRDVRCVWLTDGGGGGQSVERRRLESIAVLTGLGLERSQLHFVGEDCGIPDGKLHLHLDTVVERLSQTVANEAELLLPAWEGGHHDHDASHLVGIELSRGSAMTLRQYSLYHGEGLKGPWFKVLSPLPANGPSQWATTGMAERLGYVACCLKYRSQWKSFVGLLPFYAWRMRRGDAFVLQPVKPERTAQRPHPGALLYERRGGPSWEKFAELTRRYRCTEE